MSETPVNKPRIPVRKAFVWIVVIMAVAFVIVSITEIEDILTAVRSGNIAFLLLAVALELVCLLNNAMNYRTLYHLVGLEESLRQIFLISTSSTFINMIAPSGGFGGMVVFMDSAKQRNYSPAKVVVVVILYMIYEYVSLLGVVALGFVALIQRQNLTTGQIIAAGVLMLFIILFSLLLYLGSHSSKQFGELLFKGANWINRLMYRFFHRDLIQAEQAHKLAADIEEGVMALRGKKSGLLAPLLYALCNKALLIGVLTSVFLSLQVPFSTGTIVAGYSIAQLIFYITPSPAGIGFVGGIFPITLNALLVPFAKAVLITLIYRGITLWFSFAIGFFSFQKLQRENANASPHPSEPA